jgi:hypothetical protein
LAQDKQPLESQKAAKEEADRAKLALVHEPLARENLLETQEGVDAERRKRDNDHFSTEKFMKHHSDQTKLWLTKVQQIIVATTSGSTRAPSQSDAVPDMHDWGSGELQEHLEQKFESMNLANSVLPAMTGSSFLHCCTADYVKSTVNERCPNVAFLEQDIIRYLQLLRDASRNCHHCKAVDVSIEDKATKRQKQQATQHSEHDRQSQAEQARQSQAELLVKARQDGAEIERARREDADKVKLAQDELLKNTELQAVATYKASLTSGAQR